MRTYGAKPTKVGHFDIEGSEQFYYQYLPIKLPDSHGITVESRLSNPFGNLIGMACCDFIGLRGIDDYVGSHVYITAKRQLQTPGRTLTRPGWHTDGFMTDDINYIWYDSRPTIFNFSEFNLTQDDVLSIREMGEQAKPKNDYTYEEGTLLRLDQFDVHRADDSPHHGVRTFVKLSFSFDKYDLQGNSINYLLNYNWKMRPREDYRNVPQLLS